MSSSLFAYRSHSESGLAALLWRLPILICVVIWFYKPLPAVVFLNTSDIVLEQGLAYKVTVVAPPKFPFVIYHDSAQGPASSSLRLFQGEVELGPAHSLHQQIRELGDGRFSHWSNSLYFSGRGGKPIDKSTLKAIIPYEIPFVVVLIFFIGLVFEAQFWLRRLSVDQKTPSLFKIFLWAMNGVLSVSIVYFFYDTLRYAPMGVDGGLYLSFAERINDGWVLYRDVRPSYAPLGILIMALFRGLLGNIFDPYVVYLGTVLLFELLTGIAVYWITSYFTTQHCQRYLVAAITVLGCHMHEGNIVVLEPFVTLFNCLAIGFFFKRSNGGTFVSGLLTGCAFLSKQYGALGIFPFLIVIVFLNLSLRDKLAHLLLISLGFLVPILVLLLLGLIYGVSPLSILTTFWTPGYVQQIADPSHLLSFVIRFLPFLLVAPLLLLRMDVRSSPIWWTILLSVFFFGLTLLVRPFGHYFILIIPYSLLVCAFMIEKLRAESSAWLRCGGAALILTLYPMIRESFHKPLSKLNPNARQEQFEISRMVNEVWPKRTQALIFGEPWIVYKAGILPVKAPHFDYTFLSFFSADELAKTIADNDKVFIDLVNEGYFLPVKKTFEEQYGDFEKFLLNQGYCLKAVRQGRYQFWERGCNIAT